MAAQIKSIVITGDFIRDINLFEHSDPLSPRHADAVGALRQSTQFGGAWYLQELVSQALAGSDWVAVGSPAVAPEADLPRAFQTWRAFAASRGDKKNRVWRIDNLMGCEVPEEATLARVSEAGPENPALLVIDDLGLGFRRVATRQAELWPAALNDPGQPDEIVVKTSCAPDDSPLWHKLLQPAVAGRLTVVISADALRERGALIAKALSWDQAVDDLDCELAEGRSARDLACCRRAIVLFGSEGVAVYQRDAHDPLRFTRFLFDPERQEGTWKAAYPGRVFGNLTILTVALVQHLVQPSDYPLCLVLARALNAMRASHIAGFGPGDKTPNENASLSAALSVLKPDITAKGYQEPLRQFATAYPLVGPQCSFGFRSRLSEPKCAPRRCDLLRDMVGTDYEDLIAKGIEIVLRGPKQALAGVPCAEYGDYFTVDREEIERINAIRSLIVHYRGNRNEKTPLSIAVFGAPGSGKSFAIKELLKTTVPPGDKMETLVFNLTELKDQDALVQALHQVRDGTVRGTVPLVFWDEFDTDSFKWLRHFLAPMQDASFTANGHTHPLGRAIFVFAGGVYRTFDPFCKEAKEHSAQKVPDFLSQLRGYLNVKGPNPQAPDAAQSHPPRILPWEEACRADPAHVIRRAIFLWVNLRLSFPRLVERPAVSPDVINAFLRVRCYHHGARSLAAVIAMSDLAQASRFEASALPPPDLLRLHVSEDFLNHVPQGQLLQPAIERLAEAHHAEWRKEKQLQGYRYGPERSDEPGKLTHPRLMDYAKLKEEWKEDNRITARLTQAKLRRLGYEIHGAVTGAAEAPQEFSDEQIQRLMEMEHDIWLRDHLAHGWEYATETKDQLFLHRCAAPMGRLSADDQRLDLAIAKSILPVLRETGYALAKIHQPEPTDQESPRGPEQ